MASSSLLLLQLQPLNSLSYTSHNILLFHQNNHYIPPLKVSAKPFLSSSKPLTVLFALTESDSPKSLQPDSQTLLQELADSFDLPSDYLAQLPRDLRIDLNDAAFDLSNGLVVDECGQELGDLLLNLARAWEQADTSTSHSLVKKLSALESSLTDSAKSAFGKRLISAGRRFQAMGQYGQGELQKFGELQVEVTPEKANIGAAIGFVFGILSWELGQGIQSIPESSLQYANDNALLLAKSLRGALLAACYSSTLLSAFTVIGLFLYGRQLASKEK